MLPRVSVRLTILSLVVLASISTAADWRYANGPAPHRSAWYPTMRLFRQNQPGDWEGVFARMADELRRLIAGQPLEQSD